MRSISSIITKGLALLLVLVFAAPSAMATSMDETLTLSMISVKTKHLNPLLSEEREFQSLTALMYEGLYSLDDDYMPELCLAESCEPSSNGKTWTVTMRKNVKFHNGQPCTAYDVEATVNQILELAQAGQGQYNQLQYIIESVSANSAESLRINVKRPYFGVKYALTFPVLPKDQVLAEIPAGTGPYYVENFQPANFLYLSANQDWWQGAPFVQNINAMFCATNRELISDYEYNRVDAAITRSASAGQYRTGLTNLNIPYRTRQLETLLMNFREFPLENKLVREAIRYAVDVDAIANTIYMGMAERTNTPMPAGTWMYHADDSLFRYDPEKAKALLAEAGWKEDTDGDGVLDMIKDGKSRRLRLRLYVYEEQQNSVRVQAANMIKDDLEAIGMEIEVITGTFSNISARLREGHFDLCLAAFQMDVVPDPGFLLMPGNTGNYGNYRSTDMDKLFKKLRSSISFDEYRNTLYDIQDQFVKDCPFLCLYYRRGALLTRKVCTVARDVREPEILRGIESIGK